MRAHLAACPAPPWINKVWYLKEGRRRWVPSVEYLTCYGWSLGEVVQATGAEIQSYGLGGPVPMRWLDDAWNKPLRTSPAVLREIACSRLLGHGIEFGPGTSPMPVPLDTQVQFADFLPEDDVRSRKSEAAGNDFARLDYVMGIEDPHLIPDASVDFVVTSHVIEHVRNPLRAFEEIYRILKPGGQFVLAVPDKPRTFDRDRELTTLEHLILDYEHPDANRDKAHYSEFFRVVYGITEDLDKKVEATVAINGDTHFHTWTYETFAELVSYSQRFISPWRSVWSQPAIEGNADSFEFYFALTA